MSETVPTVTNPADLSNADKFFSGGAQKQEGISFETFIASVYVAAAVFLAELLVFMFLRTRMKRVYEPRTYLVPEKRRVDPPGSGLFAWLIATFRIPDKKLIAKSGLDGYMFLRYLYMLLKIFIIVAIPTLPILLPINSINGRNDSEDPPVKGLDRLAWGNVAMTNTNRYWAHVLLSIYLVLVCCYVFYKELRHYVRLRQDYLTSPEHRLRASATTVLISGIPRKYLNVEALINLYDVFPGGLRNVWINRDYDELAEKVKERDQLALALEKAETLLIQRCKKNYIKQMRKEGKTVEDTGENGAMGPGLSSGNPHQIPGSPEDTRPTTSGKDKKFNIKKFVPIPLVGDGLEKIVSGGGKVVNTIGNTVKREVSEFAPESSYRNFDGDQQGLGVNTSPGVNSPPALVQSTSNVGTDRKRGSTLLTYTRTNESYNDQHNDERPDANVDSHHVSGGKSRTLSKMFHRHNGEEDERPITMASPTSPTAENGSGSFEPNYKPAFNEAYDNDNDPDGNEPVWKKYATEKDRETMRLPIFGLKWMPSLPLIGKKVDTIYHCRREVARLNMEIEEDQRHPERYPLMNSAFIQFNSQMAAHMACQSVSHHVPEYMTPRYIEVSPEDVIWDNMRIKWWERYIRTALVTAMVTGLIIGWAFPVAFVGLVSQINYLTTAFTWLEWLNDLPDKLLGLISGVLPPVGLAILMAVLPVILRIFAKIRGVHTGMAVEQAVQSMYFAFLFIQVFLVVSISSGITAIIKEVVDNPSHTPAILAENLPKASNFFFSYLVLQAFAVSGGAILQIGVLVVNYVVARFLDTTAREKWKRQTTLIQMKWGTFFPVYTNLACIGIIYSIISPLILVFNMFTFALFWIVYRYNLLYVANFRFDHGGLLFPRAVNQLFTGIYVMEVCQIGLLFVVRDENNNASCFPQAIIMIILTGFTFIYQYSLNKAFGPLLTYIPTTLEDDAVERDQKFAERQALIRSGQLVDDDDDNQSFSQRLGEKDAKADDAEMHAMQNGRGKRSLKEKLLHLAEMRKRISEHGRRSSEKKARKSSKDIESQARGPGSLHHPKTTLFDHLSDEIEDLTPEERDALVAHAFQHEALRAKRPVIWLPRDDLGVSDDEITRMKRLSEEYLWVSNEYAGLDARGKVVYGRSPPDFDARDLIEL